MRKQEKWLPLSWLLSYQRNFNLINGERSIGKTYTLQKFFINQGIKKKHEFIFLVRTTKQIEEKKVFRKAFEKIIANEFKDYIFEFTNTEMYLVNIISETERELILIGHCIALSEAVKMKNESFPRVKYMYFDEYMLEPKDQKQYVNGWDEPDALLSIYHTVDREEDRVIIFLLGNNTSFYNPYHMHKAFHIPKVEKGEIWCSENVLFYWATASEELQEQKSKSKFLRMIDGSNYGNYAKDGNYVGDNYSFVMTMQNPSRYCFTLAYDNINYGVYLDNKLGLIFISDSYDQTNNLIYSLTLGDHKENTLLTRSKTNVNMKWLSSNFKNGNVRFTSMEVRVRIEKGVAMLL